MPVQPSSDLLQHASPALVDRLFHSGGTPISECGALAFVGRFGVVRSGAGGSVPTSPRDRTGCGRRSVSQIGSATRSARAPCSALHTGCALLAYDSGLGDR